MKRHVHRWAPSYGGYQCHCGKSRKTAPPNWAEVAARRAVAVAARKRRETETVLPEGPIKYIHVNKHRIAANLKHGRSDPVITVKMGRQNIYGHVVEIRSHAVILTAGCPLPDTNQIVPQLKCGARVYIQTRGEVIII
jgi:hypothetical protein